MIVAACKHGEIITWRAEGGEPMMWSCVTCRHKFVPIAQLMQAEDALRAALAADADRVSAPRDADAIVDEYAQEYEFDDGDCFHQPNEIEGMLLCDFGHGLVSILHERGLLAPMLAAHEKEPKP